jgi:hypothetical protein
MSDQLPVLLPTEADARRRRVNGPELALWIIGVVLLFASGVLTFYFIKLIQVQTAEVNIVQSDLGFFVAFTQSATIFTPGLVTAGVLCIALALFLRGLDINARRREARFESATSTQAPTPPLTESAATQTPVPAPAVRTPPLTDYSAFMRPSDEPADRTK